MAKNFEEQKQKKIDAAIKAKVKRMATQQISINTSWSINCALNSLTEKEKADWGPAREKIKERSGWFRELHQQIVDEEELNQDAIMSPKTANQITEEQVIKQEEGKKWQEKYNTMCESDEINSQLQEASELQKEI